ALDVAPVAARKPPVFALRTASRASPRWRTTRNLSNKIAAFGAYAAVARRNGRYISITARPMRPKKEPIMLQTILGKLALFRANCADPYRTVIGTPELPLAHDRIRYAKHLSSISLSRMVRLVAQREDLCHANRAAQSLKQALSLGLPVNALTQVPPAM